MQATDPPRLPDDTRARLARLLGMLGSHHDGEALNAARLADRLVRSSGLTWTEVLSPPPALDPQPDEAFAEWPGGWRGACAWVMRHGTLSQFETDFCRVIAGYIGDPSVKQQIMLRRILERTLAEGARS